VRCVWIQLFNNYCLLTQWTSHTCLLRLTSRNALATCAKHYLIDPGVVAKVLKCTWFRDKFIQYRDCLFKNKNTELFAIRACVPNLGGFHCANQTPNFAPPTCKRKQTMYTMQNAPRRHMGMATGFDCKLISSSTQASVAQLTKQWNKSLHTLRKRYVKC